MGTKNISISEEAYARLAAKKRPQESFTDVINRITGKRSILELRGLLPRKEGQDMLSEIREIRMKSERRIKASSRRIQEAHSNP